MAARLLLVLLALGLMLADLSVVAAPLPVARAASEVQGDPIEDGALPCAGASCHSAMAAAPAEKRGAVRARVPGPADPGPLRTHDVLARILSLARLTPARGQFAFNLLLDQLPWRPAREAGSDRSVPRPPPV